MAAFKGKVLYVTEENNNLLYFVKVKKIIKQGYKMLKEKDKVTFYKRDSCTSPDLKQSSQYLFMGKMKRQADTSWTRHRLLNCGLNALLVTRTNAS